LDTSYSMQSKGKQGELLKRSIQELLENIPKEQTFTLLTSDNSFYDTDIRSIQKDLQNIKYSTSFSIANQIAKVKTLNSEKTKDIVIITDGKSLKAEDIEALDKNQNIVFSVPKAESLYNVSIDSVYIERVSDDFYDLKVNVSIFGKPKTEIGLALYNQNELVAKMLLPKNQNSVVFTISKEDFNGYVQLEDNSLEYDNTYYFSISKPEKIKILSIGSKTKNVFLSKIYTEDYFEFYSFEPKTLDYNRIEEQHALILNELDEIPQSLIVTLKAFIENGGNFIFIPSEKTNPNDLTQFFSQFGNITFSPIQNHKKQITKIAFEHPIFRNVFEKKTDNFQYPSVSKSFNINGNLLAVLSYQDNEVFLGEIKKNNNSVYIFSAPISIENSNFLNSPLVVLSFYNITQNKIHSGVVSRFITDTSPFFLESNLSKNQILTVKNNSEEFIPNQQIFNRKVKLNFNEYPKESGNYGIYKNEELLANIGFNYDRSESDLTIDNVAFLSDFPKKNIATIFSDLQTNRTDNNLWKYFLLFGLLFLVFEILIQKFVE